MDKVEYREIVRDIKTKYLQKDYESVISISKQLELEKIRENSVLEMISRAYETVGRYDIARDVLLVAYRRNPTGKRMAYNLAILCIKLDDLDNAVMFYEDFCKMAPKDNKRYILKYEIGKAGGVPIKDLIRVLEVYNSKEMDEKWQFELATLFDELNNGEKCAAACDQLLVWYSNGEYEKKALKLKQKYKPLTAEQEKRFEKYTNTVRREAPAVNRTNPSAEIEHVESVSPVQEMKNEIDYGTKHLAPAGDRLDNFEEEAEEPIAGQLSIENLFVEFSRDIAVNKKKTAEIEADRLAYIVSQVNDAHDSSALKKFEEEEEHESVDKVIEPEVPLLERNDEIAPVDDGGEDLCEPIPEFAFEKKAAGIYEEEEPEEKAETKEMSLDATQFISLDAIKAAVAKYEREKTETLEVEPSVVKENDVYAEIDPGSAKGRVAVGSKSKDETFYEANEEAAEAEEFIVEEEIIEEEITEEEIPVEPEFEEEINDNDVIDVDAEVVEDADEPVENQDEEAAEAEIIEEPEEVIDAEVIEEPAEAAETEIIEEPAEAAAAVEEQPVEVEPVQTAAEAKPQEVKAAPAEPKAETKKAEPVLMFSPISSRRSRRTEASAYVHNAKSVSEIMPEIKETYAAEGKNDIPEIKTDVVSEEKVGTQIEEAIEEFQVVETIEEEAAGIREAEVPVEEPDQPEAEAAEESQSEAEEVKEPQPEAAEEVNDNEPAEEPPAEKAEEPAPFDLDIPVTFKKADVPLEALFAAKKKAAAKAEEPQIELDIPVTFKKPDANLSMHSRKSANGKAQANGKAKPAERKGLAERLKEAEEAKKAEKIKAAEEAKKAERIKAAKAAKEAERIKAAEEAKKAEQLKAAKEAEKAEQLEAAEEAREAERSETAEEIEAVEEFEEADTNEKTAKTAKAAKAKSVEKVNILAHVNSAASKVRPHRAKEAAESVEDEEQLSEVKKVVRKAEKSKPSRTIKAEARENDEKSKPSKAVSTAKAATLATFATVATAAAAAKVSVAAKAKDFKESRKNKESKLFSGFKKLIPSRKAKEVEEFDYTKFDDLSEFDGIDDFNLESLSDSELDALLSGYTALVEQEEKASKEDEHMNEAESAEEPVERKESESAEKAAEEVTETAVEEPKAATVVKDSKESAEEVTETAENGSAEKVPEVKEAEKASDNIDPVLAAIEAFELSKKEATTRINIDDLFGPEESDKDSESFDDIDLESFINTEDDKNGIAGDMDFNLESFMKMMDEDQKTEKTIDPAEAAIKAFEAAKKEATTRISIEDLFGSDDTIGTSAEKPADPKKIVVDPAEAAIAAFEAAKIEATTRIKISDLFDLSDDDEAEKKEDLKEVSPLESKDSESVGPIENQVEEDTTPIVIPEEAEEEIAAEPVAEEVQPAEISEDEKEEVAAEISEIAEDVPEETLAAEIFESESVGEEQVEAQPAEETQKVVLTEEISEEAPAEEISEEAPAEEISEEAPAEDILPNLDDFIKPSLDAFTTPGLHPLNLFSEPEKQDEAAPEEKEETKEEATSQFSLEELLASAEADAQAAVSEHYTITEELRQKLTEFLLVDGMEEHICEVIDSLIAQRRAGDRTGGNLIVTGDAKSGKTFLTIAVLKEVNRIVGTGNSRVAKVQGGAINGRDVRKVLSKVVDADLIIENVGLLDDDTIKDLIDAVQESDSLMIVLEGNALAAANITNNHPEIEKYFKTRLDIEELSLKEWAGIAREYAKEKGFAINDMARLALHAKIAESNTPDIRLGYDVICNIVDAAIAKCGRRNTKIFTKAKKDGELIELLESDFI